jgi:SAM-dependent methyltransferase
LWKERFQAARERDLGRTPERRFLCRWAISEEFHSWTGIEDIRRWLGHIENITEELDHTRWLLPIGEPENELLSVSKRFNDTVFRNLFGESPPDHRALDFYNMTDWVLQHAYPRPSDERLERVLDFGAGFGRQAALWLSKQDRTTYVAIDAVELPYLAQLHYLASAPFPFHDYLHQSDSFEVRPTEESTAFHLPSWRFDLLPPGFFDMVICVQVLPEVTEDVLFHSLSVFRRALRPGGYLYIRQHGSPWRPGHKQDVEELLPRFGFQLEFAPRWRDREDVHGLPQVWRLASRVGDQPLLRDRARRAAQTVRKQMRRYRYTRHVW